MYLAGWQKLSLVDFPGKVACTLFTGGCNLRCPYCHNSELLEGAMPRVDTAEVLAYLDQRQGILDGVVVSGGEPCMQPDLLDFLATLKGKELLVKLDTNGCYSDVLQQALERNLVDYVAMDLKNSPEEYALTTGSDDVPLENIAKSVELLLRQKIPFELRTTVVVQLHSKHSFEKMRDFLLPLVAKTGKKIPDFYLQAFKDRDTVPFAGFTAPDRNTLEAYGALLATVANNVHLRGV